MLNLIESDPETDPPQSQTSQAYSRIRSDLLAGRFAPGQRLKIGDLATAIEVSPGAIREALSRLVPEQLVVSRDQKGFVVAPLSGADLQDLTDVRCEVEAIALRRSVERGDAAWEAAVLAAAHRLRRTSLHDESSDRNISREWAERHAAFHATLVAACGSRRLIALHGQLYEQSERYRVLSAHIKADRDIAGEHQALVDAALDRDANQLVTLALTHFRQTTVLILDAARNPEGGLLSATNREAILVP
jgi:DNA-binding GntR family transcriptional regulator